MGQFWATAVDRPGVIGIPGAAIHIYKLRKIFFLVGQRGSLKLEMKREREREKAACVFVCLCVCVSSFILTLCFIIIARCKRA